jgi:hypothetical protein
LWRGVRQINWSATRTRCGEGERLLDGQKLFGEFAGEAAAFPLPFPEAISFLRLRTLKIIGLVLILV